MIDWSKYPRCRSYLLAQKDRLDDDKMNEYYAALCVAFSFSEASLKSFGGINFNAMKGPQLIARMEEFLAFRPKKKYSPQKPKKPIDRINRGISEEQIDAAKSPKGGWKRETLESWGVEWPAPKGWRKKLIKNYAEGKR